MDRHREREKERGRDGIDQTGGRAAGQRSEAEGEAEAVRAGGKSPRSGEWEVGTARERLSLSLYLVSLFLFLSTLSTLSTLSRSVGCGCW
jgi:hypothetical protein